MSDNNASTSQKVQSSTGLIIENRILEDIAISKILVRDVFERLPAGRIAVVTDKPVAMLSAVRKQWLKLFRQTQRARSSTLDHERQAQISYELAMLQDTTFTADNPLNDPVANVHFATAAQFLAAPPICATLIIVEHIERYELYMLSSWMPRNGKVIIYGQT